MTPQKLSVRVVEIAVWAVQGAGFFMDTITQPPRGVSGNLEKSKANELTTKAVNRGHR